MASSSSSSIVAMDSCRASVCSYDVFLSFRGEDTRHSFTDHLYHKLIQSGICAFRDEEEINRGEELKPEIEKAIKASRASIVVLSENYATSSWCLEELVLILQQRRVFNHFVLPIFYHVNPTDVRKHKGNFAVEKDSWKTALTEVANLSGFTLSGPETTTLKEVVDTIYNRLDQKEVHLPLNIVGMASRYNEISSWFDQCSVEFLAIYGMGGSGKTTLAKYIYNLHRRTFEYVSFIEDIGSRCKAYDDLLELQKQLLKDIVGGKRRKIPCISRGMCMIQEVLQMNRTLIVLDDIVERGQLVALLGTGKINSQSKIIITSRENVDNWFDIPYWRCQKYEMRLLNDDESLELFCCHAFRSETHHEGYDQVVKYCEGNPLALEVLGSSTSKCSADIIMPSQLRLFEIDMDSRIQSVLMRSYLSLPCNTVKELFLHIACFFVGIDIDYVVTILEPDYAARSGIETLLEKCLLSISPNKKLMMHRLLQEMAKNIVRQESTKFPVKRSRVWLSSDSYNILSKGKGSKTIEGLALDMKMLQKENYAFKSLELKTNALKNMEILKLLQLNFAELSGSYECVSENLRWLCWHGFHLRTIPSDLYMGNLVAIDMSYSNLEVFEPPTVLPSLQILNLKDSHDLSEIRNIFNIPCLETLILWNCYGLVNVSKTIGDLTHLALLNMTGCKNLFNREQMNLVEAPTSGTVVTKQPTFSFPVSLHQLFLKDCNLECTDSLPLSFSVQPYLQHLNLCNSLFESLPCYNHLENLRVLDLSFCSRLKCLLCLPGTLAELYVYYCESLERITFQSHRFPLQEFGYEGCVNLYEIENYIKLVPIAKLDETDLGHMKWLREYQNHEVHLVGDDELTVGRCMHIQMLFEFNIMSISLPCIRDPNLTPTYTSNLPSLTFEVPSCPENKTLEGINVIFKYSISNNDWAWFCKISTTDGSVDLMYSPKVFGKPEMGELCIWLSYWPIGNILDIGDTVNVSIVVMSGLEVHEIGVSLVYSNQETVENDMGWAVILGGELSGFQLSTGAYYLCRRDFFELMEVGRLSPDWFGILVGDNIDYTEVRGWRKTGRPKQVNGPSFTELKTVRCIIYGPQLDDIYNITEMSKSSFGDKDVALTSGLFEEEMHFGTRSELIHESMEGKSLSMKRAGNIFDNTGKPLGAFRGSYFGSGGDHIDKQVHSEEVNNESKSPLQQELQMFQDQVFSHFNALSTASDDQFLSIDWMAKLLDAFVACQEHFTAILSNNAGNHSKPPLDMLLTQFFDMSIKALDICNAVRDGIEKVRLWHKHLEIVSSAFDSKQRNVIFEGQFRRARKALNDLAVVMFDDHKDSGSVPHRNRSFSRPNRGKDINQRKQGHSQSLSWSVSRSWSASKQLQSMAYGLVQPRANEIAQTFGLANCVYTMGFVLMFVLWTVVAAIPCQDRGVFSFSLPKHYPWSNPMSLIHTRVLDESKKREHKNSPGLLAEIYQMEKSINLISDLIDSAHQFPLTEEQQKEVKEGVQELSLVCNSCKNGLDTFERQLREVFYKIRKYRVEGLGTLNRT